MRSTARNAVILSLMLIQGCVGTPSILGKSQQQSLQSPPLFDRDGTPLFSAYVSCTSEDQSCATVHKMLSEWANNRGIALHLVDADDAVFLGGGKHVADKPYRLGLKIKPLVVPSFFQFRGGQHPMGGYAPPRVGYNADVYVIDAATGSVLHELPVHQEQTTKPEGTVNPYLQSEMARLLVSLDPAYRPAN